MIRITFVVLFLFTSIACSPQSSLPTCPTDTSIAWTDCFGTITSQDGSTYVGEWKEGKRLGQGAMTSQDGTKYVGHFTKDFKNEEGTLTFRNGDKYVGTFENNKPNGQGTFTYPDGRRYVGEFRDGSPSGAGTYTWPDGSKYVGDYKAGYRSGRGTYTFPNGDEYVGEFKDDEASGQGTYTYHNGNQYVGEHKNWKPHGQGSLVSSRGYPYVAGVWLDDLTVKIDDARWHLVTYSTMGIGLDQYFISMDSIKTENLFRQALIMIANAAPNKEGTLSRKHFVRFDCRQKRHMQIQGGAFSGSFGSGHLLGAFNQSSWNSVAPASTWETLMRYVCEHQISPRK